MVTHACIFVCASVCQRWSADKKKIQLFWRVIGTDSEKMLFPSPGQSHIQKTQCSSPLVPQSCVVGSSIWLLYLDWSKSVIYSYSDLVGLNRHQEDLHGGLKSFRIYSRPVYSTELQVFFLVFFAYTWFVFSSGSADLGMKWVFEVLVLSWSCNWRQAALCDQGRAFSCPERVAPVVKPSRGSSRTGRHQWQGKKEGGEGE